MIDPVAESISKSTTYAFEASLCTNDKTPQIKSTLEQTAAKMFVDVGQLNGLLLSKMGREVRIDFRNPEANIA